jgi:hypothetical protein
MQKCRTDSDVYRRTPTLMPLSQEVPGGIVGLGSIIGGPEDYYESGSMNRHEERRAATARTKYYAVLMR